jgi:hypothetical protein
MRSAAAFARGTPRGARAALATGVAAVAIAAVALLALTSCSRQPTVRVLFVGNSFTAINGGLDKQLERLTPYASTGSVTFGGFTLENHWTDGHALESIRQGGWTYVVLQEQSVTPVMASAQFYQYVEAFNREIVRAGARTVLLMTWERPDMVKGGVTTKALAAAYDGVGWIVGAKVVPAGTTFAASLAQRPDLVLNAQDGHPTAYGTYLAGCVLYGTLFDKTPVGNVASDPGVPPDVQAYLQNVAARALGY